MQGGGGGWTVRGALDASTYRAHANWTTFTAKQPGTVVTVHVERSYSLGQEAVSAPQLGNATGDSVRRDSGGLLCTCRWSQQSNVRTCGCLAQTQQPPLHITMLLRSSKQWRMWRWQLRPKGVAPPLAPACPAPRPHAHKPEPPYDTAPFPPPVPMKHRHPAPSLLYL